VGGVARRAAQFEATELAKDKEVEKVRFKNIHLQFQLRKLEGKIKEKEQLAEGLHLIDFEQLKIENLTLNEKIEDRNEELHKLKKKTTQTVQVLTHVKEKLQFVQTEAEVRPACVRVCVRVCACVLCVCVCVFVCECVCLELLCARCHWSNLSPCMCSPRSLLAVVGPCRPCNASSRRLRSRWRCSEIYSRGRSVPATEFAPTTTGECCMRSGTCARVCMCRCCK
jgi:hypothetical protein